jgi:hypothetical protein
MVLVLLFVFAQTRIGETDCEHFPAVAISLVPHPSRSSETESAPIFKHTLHSFFYYLQLTSFFSHSHSVADADAATKAARSAKQKFPELLRSKTQCEKNLKTLRSGSQLFYVGCGVQRERERRSAALPARVAYILNMYSAQNVCGTI